MNNFQDIIKLAQDNPAIAGWGGLILLFFFRSWLGLLFSKWFWLVAIGAGWYAYKKGMI